MKKIGLIDYYINEWHALNYPSFLKVAKKDLKEDFQITDFYAEIDHPDLSSDEFEKQYGVHKCSSLEELCNKCDYLMVLYPDNPERKFETIKKVIPFKKPIFVDKTFMNTYLEAKATLDLADQFGTPLFTSSSLRYADELKTLENPESLLVIAPSVHLSDYWIHPLEIVVSKMGSGAIRAKLSKSGVHHMLNIEYKDNKTALIVIAEGGNAQDFFVSGNGKFKQNLVRLTSPYFENEMRDILRFFIEKKPSFSKQQTLEAMRLRDIALENRFDEWIKLD